MSATPVYGVQVIVALQTPSHSIGAIPSVRPDIGDAIVNYPRSHVERWMC